MVHWSKIEMKLTTLRNSEFKTSTSYNWTLGQFEFILRFQLPVAPVVDRRRDVVPASSPDGATHEASVSLTLDAGTEMEPEAWRYCTW